MNLQAIKDTFYAALRDRIATINPTRTCVVRGALRPGVAVKENELAGVPETDLFGLQWTALSIDPLGMIAAKCEILYTTAGTTGLDRGRALAAMDEELRLALGSAPQSSELQIVTEIPGGGASALADSGTRIFWDGPHFDGAALHAERVQRTAAVEVFGYE